jgi:PiT family inorganic phosphate transporter
MPPLLIVIIAIALIFDFLNGFHDSSNIVATVHAFGSQLASAGVILGAALLGGPVSTTQVVSSVIMGAGSADRVSKVRWTVARDIAVAWLLIIPMAALLAAGLYLLVDLVV